MQAKVFTKIDYTNLLPSDSKAIAEMPDFNGNTEDLAARYLKLVEGLDYEDGFRKEIDTSFNKYIELNNKDCNKSLNAVFQILEKELNEVKENKSTMDLWNKRMKTVIESLSYFSAQCDGGKNDALYNLYLSLINQEIVVSQVGNMSLNKKIDLLKEQIEKYKMDLMESLIPSSGASQHYYLGGISKIMSKGYIRKSNDQKNIADKHDWNSSNEYIAT